jgi:hypothetical protein
MGNNLLQKVISLHNFDILYLRIYCTVFLLSMEKNVRKDEHTLCADSRLGIDFPASCRYLSLHIHTQTIRS